MLNHTIQELITKAIEKQTEKIITKKSQKKIQQEEVIFNKPHLFASGYYQAYAFFIRVSYFNNRFIIMHFHSISSTSF